MELLQELRVAGLGVQVLFGFLLALPFTTRFTELEPWQRGLYVAILVLAAVATALLTGPVAYHRFVFRQRQKEQLVKTANALAIAGLVAVALAVSGAVLLIGSYVVKGLLGVLVGAGVGCLFAALWFAFPLARREGSDRQQHPPAAP
jgi:hypothetical protein